MSRVYNRRDFLKILAVGAGAIGLPTLLYLAWLDEQENRSVISYISTRVPTRTSTLTSTPTATSSPTNTPSPTETPTPTDTPEPTSTLLPIDWYVDSKNGKDTNAGTSPDQAFATIARLQEVLKEGQAVGLARGSHWREQFTIAQGNIKIVAYGNGDKPILDCSDNLDNSSFTKSSGYQNVYEITISPDLYNTKTWVRAWEGDLGLLRVASLSECDATPGSYFPSADTGSPPITLYIHASDSSDVRKNGKVYAASIRRYGIESSSANNIFIDGIETRRNLSEDGSLKLGNFGRLENCICRDGSKHNLYVRTGAYLKKVEAVEAYYAGMPATMFVYNDNSPNSEGVTFEQCTARCTKRDARVTGFYGHRNVSGDFGVVKYDRCQAINCNLGFQGDHATKVQISDLTVQDCTFAVRTGGTPLTGVGLRVTGPCNNVVGITSGEPQIRLSEIDAQVECENSLLVYTKSGGDISITDSRFQGASFAGANRIFYIENEKTSLTLTRNVYGDGFAHVYYMPKVGTVASDENCFEAEKSSFKMNGADYVTVSDWQRDADQDTNSTVGSCGGISLIDKLYQWLFSDI
jgi:hypothetical protein